MTLVQTITPCLWFDGQAEEAANFYVGIFPNSRITGISRFSDEGQEIHGREAGSVMTVQFELDGHTFTGLNGGPLFRFTEAISFQVNCDTQEEIDHYWEKLGEGGDPNAQQCGWLKDRFGVSWQVISREMEALFKSGDTDGERRAMRAMLGMKKIDIEEMRAAFSGSAGESPMHDSRA